MKKKLFSLVLASVLCLSFLTGCQLGSRTTTYPVKPRKTKDNGKPLTIYCGSDVVGETSRLIYTYNNQVDKAHQVEIYEVESSDQMGTAVATEILAGKGPDLFLCNSFSLQSYYQLRGSGLFQDLNYYLEKDSSIDLSSYNEEMLEEGIYEQQRITVPLYYKAEPYGTTKEKMEEYGVPEDFQLVEDDLSSLLSLQEQLEQKGASIFPFYSPVPNIACVLPRFMNYETQESKFHTEEFQKLAEEYKSIERIKKEDEKYLLDWNSVNIGEIVSMADTAQGEYVFIPVRESAGGKYSIYPALFAAISQNSPNGERAFEFILWCLSETTQMEQYQTCIPVNTKALNALITQECVGKDDLKAQYYDFINNLSITSGPDYKFVLEIFEPLWNEYMDDKMSVEELTKELDNKARIYLKEQA